MSSHSMSKRGQATVQSRRSFIAALGGAAVSVGPLKALARTRAPILYPPDDLSYFDKTLKPAGEGIRFGYHAITWGTDDQQAIKDISEVGFRGIQLRANVLREYGERPKELAELLESHRLQFVALSSGGVSIDPAKEAEELAAHLRHARFVRDAGGLYLQLTDSARPKDRKPAPDDFKRLGSLLTEISRRAGDLGVSVGYHNHMNSLGEAPDEVDRILEASDPRYLKFELDVAHYTQGGGDPVKAIRRHKDRLLFLHIKDVESPVPEDPSKKYRFVELGRGKVNLTGVFKALHEAAFSGWAIVELDSVPDKARTPKESAVISKKYLEEKIGLRI